MDGEALIAEIFNRPQIWKTKHRHHKNKKVLNRLWEEINQSFPNYDVTQLKKKWKNLRDAYRKELKKSLVSQSGDPVTDDEDSMRQWKYYNALTFLKDEFMPAETESNVTKTEYQDLDDSELQATLSPRPSNPLSISPEPTTSQSEIPDFSRNRQMFDIPVEYLEIEKNKLKKLEQESKKTQNKPDVEISEDYYYLMSILPEMQKLSSIQKMRVRNKINQVLMDELVYQKYLLC